MTSPAIEVRNLSKSYGSIHAVDDANFKIEAGELVGFLGLNGAGKTTTMRILTTFMPASSGYAFVAGFDVMYQSMEVRQKLGYLPESVPIYPEMRVEEYLLTRAKLKGIDRTRRASRIDYVLDRCRIVEVRRRLIGSLSKGYRQRVGLADALIADPPVLILDEPLSGLDPIQQEETLATIRGLAGQHTVLFSSHQLTDVEKVCDRVIIIHRGRIKFDDKLSQFANKQPLLMVEVRGPLGEVQKALKQLDGVTDVRDGAADDGWTTFELQLGHDKDPREQVARKMAEKGWGLRRLEMRRERLEDTFLKVAYQRA
jgi:ABC-2 type transport system ATP-binding protein